MGSFSRALRFVSEIKHSLLLLLLAIIFSLLGNWINLPISWLLAPMIVGIIFTIAIGSSITIPPRITIIGQSIIAIVTASNFSSFSFLTVQDYILPLLACILITASFSLLNSYLIYKFTDINFSTCFLGCIPGSGVAMVSMSEEIGANAVTVAVLQYLRVLIVSFIIPSLASLYFKNSPSAYIYPTVIINNQSVSPISISFNLIIITITVILGLWIARKISLPLAYYFGPFLSSLLLFNLFPQIATIPTYIFNLGLFFLGLSYGTKFSRQIFLKLFKAIIIDFFLILILISGCFYAGWLFHTMSHVDIMTAILGSTPGGLSAIMATVIKLGGDSDIVLMMQMTRMLLILVIAPLFGIFFQKSRTNYFQLLQTK